MVGCRLGDTLSANAGVSRGICSLRAAAWSRAWSRRTTSRSATAGCGADEAGETGISDPDALVSMNFWGFQPPILGLLRERFARFLAGSAADTKAEFLISTASTSCGRARA